MKPKKKITKPAPAPKRPVKRKAAKREALPSLDTRIDILTARMARLEETVTAVKILRAGHVQRIEVLEKMKDDLFEDLRRKMVSARELFEGWSSHLGKLVADAKAQQANRDFPMWHPIKLRGKTRDFLRAIASFNGVMSVHQAQAALKEDYTKTSEAMISHGVVMLQGDYENTWNRFYALTPYGRYLASRSDNSEEGI